MFSMSIGGGSNCMPQADPRWKIREEILNYVIDSLEIDNEDKKIAVFESVEKWIRPRQYTPKLSVYQVIEFSFEVAFNLAALAGVVLAISKFLI